MKHVQRAISAPSYALLSSAAALLLPGDYVLARGIVQNCKQGPTNKQAANEVIYLTHPLSAGALNNG